MHDEGIFIIKGIFLINNDENNSQEYQEWPRTFLVHSYGMDQEWTRNGPGMILGKFTEISSFPEFQDSSGFLRIPQEVGGGV